MIVSKNSDNASYRYIAQHDHGLLSGEIAHAYLTPQGDRLKMALVLAVATHDLGWNELDTIEALSPEEIPYDEVRGLHDFLHLSEDRKVPLYVQGIDRCEAMHSYAGLLLSLHYTAFLDEESSPRVCAQERARRARLAASLGLSGERDERLLRDYERLKFFDLVSLYACMRAPDLDDGEVPPWISSRLQLLDQRHELSWRDEHTLTIAPFPLSGPLRFDLPYREIPAPRPASALEFQTEWRAASLKRLPLTVSAP